jgi:pyruvate kinase
MLRKLILGGMNVARMNFSHGTHEGHLQVANAVKQLRAELDRPVALLLDTRGPEIRTGVFEAGKVELRPGQVFTLTTEAVEGTPERVSVTYADLPAHVGKGTRILIDDGLIELRAEKVTDTEISCRVINGGILGSRKGVNLPGIDTHMPYMDEKDKQDLRFAYENDCDFIALSFVRSAQDVRMVKEFLAELGPPRSELIAKIENAEGVENADAIIREADGLMVARGDLGIEIPFEELPEIQKRLIKRCYTAGKKVITATQMLESMIHNPRPTRAEVTDIANAIHDGTSAIMLSGETATGKYPAECLEAMNKIAVQTEKSIDYKEQFTHYVADSGHNITNAISRATVASAHDLGATAIVAMSIGGKTARMISRFRPEPPIVSVSPLAKTVWLMAMSWGVIPLLGESKETPDENMKDAIARVKDAGLAGICDLLVISGSTSPEIKFTNSIQVHVIED